MSSHVFEKGLIMKHLASTGQCPLTGANMEQNDLVELKVSKNVEPKPIGANSFPGMLKCL